MNDNQNETGKMIDELVARAKVASEEFMKLDQETINNIIKEMAMAALSNHMPLARLAVEETKRGIYEDKIIKNMFASEYVYHSIKYAKTVGEIEKNEEDDYSLIADPIINFCKNKKCNCFWISSFCTKL